MLNPLLQTAVTCCLLRCDQQWVLMVRDADWSTVKDRREAVTALLTSIAVSMSH
jgi:hypothetical protein